ncbi:MAG: hypothetical protein AUG49_19630 [Catenulispora sp. 13_1_20CM_3_70_7]|nr:MAG: hypothetical protein AUG49_19630 [Catenulispora sp. 13_1_20CM_3_70_7]
MTVTDLNQTTRTCVAGASPIGTSLADLARLTVAFTHFLAAHPELPDLHAATVEYTPASVSWALDLLTADFDADGHTAVDTWAKALNTTARPGSGPDALCHTYGAETTLIGFPIRVWSTCLTSPEPQA